MWASVLGGADHCPKKKKKMENRKKKKAPIPRPIGAVARQKIAALAAASALLGYYAAGYFLQQAPNRLVAVSQRVSLRAPVNAFFAR